MTNVPTPGSWALVASSARRQRQTGPDDDAGGLTVLEASLVLCSWRPWLGPTACPPVENRMWVSGGEPLSRNCCYGSAQLESTMSHTLPATHH
ncbi:hypothetical protein LEMLEM_LOCUS24281, partial [Lemmus lemmus]